MKAHRSSTALHHAWSARGGADKGTPFRAVLAVLAAVGLLAAVAACSTTPPSRFFILSPVQESASSRNVPESMVLRLAPVHLPEYLNRPHIITRLGPNRLHLAELDKWAEPLDANVTRVLASNLRSRLKAEVVASPSYPADQGDVRVQVRVERFDWGPDTTATLIAKWTASWNGSRRTRVLRETTSVRNGQGQGYEAAVSAMSRNLDDLASDIARTVQDLQLGKHE